jgi:hypothetical protein
MGLMEAHYAGPRLQTRFRSGHFRCACSCIHQKVTRRSAPCGSSASTFRCCKIGRPLRATPTVQITIESPSSQGVGDTLVLYSAFIMDAGTPNGYQSSFYYFANVTVIGRPANK